MGPDSSIPNEKMRRRRDNYAVKRHSIVEQRERHLIDWLNGGYKNKPKKTKLRGRTVAGQPFADETLFVEPEQEAERQSVTSDLPEGRDQDVPRIVDDDGEASKSRDTEVRGRTRTELDQRIEELEHDQQMREADSSFRMDDTFEDDEVVDIDGQDKDDEDVEMLRCLMRET